MANSLNPRIRTVSFVEPQHIVPNEVMLFVIQHQRYNKNVIPSVRRPMLGYLTELGQLIVTPSTPLDTSNYKILGAWSISELYETWDEEQVPSVPTIPLPPETDNESPSDTDSRHGTSDNSLLEQFRQARNQY